MHRHSHLPPVFFFSFFFFTEKIERKGYPPEKYSAGSIA